MMDQPSTLELISAVREFMEKHAMPELSGRTGFHARVAANALAIVERELLMGSGAAQEEALRLQDLLGVRGELLELNRELCSRIRNGEISANDTQLQEHLVKTTLLKVAIDQPTYSGLELSPHRLNR